MEPEIIPMVRMLGKEPIQSNTSLANSMGLVYFSVKRNNNVGTLWGATGGVLIPTG